MNSVITVQNLKKTYSNGTEAVKDISFEVARGEIFGIVGPNGAGKTTTLEILEGLMEPSGGRVEILGHKLPNESNQIRKKIGVQLQSSSYLPDLSLAELINLFGSFYKIKPDVNHLLSLVGLSEKSNEEVKNLSGGQKQKFSLGLSLVNDPEILFLDEPTTGLDPRSRRNLWQMIRETNKRGVTVILTTHYMEEAEFLCGRVAVMDHGKLLTINHPRKLIDNLRSTTQVSFFTENEIPAGFWKDIPQVEKVYSNYPKVILEITSLDSVPAIVNLLRQNRILFSGFTVKTASLEDVYLDLTGKGFEE